MATARHHVYFNLHRSCWSVMLRGKVKGHALALIVRDARFVVREGGRQRVLREGRKNVHAFVVGDAQGCAPSEATGMLLGGVEVTYRPTSGATFVRRDTGAPVYAADAVYMASNRKLYAANPR